jgi:cephalosporin-C deacetylase
MPAFPHSYHFDPGYGYDLSTLSAIEPPQEPHDFCRFWRARYHRAMQFAPEPVLSHRTGLQQGFEVYDLHFRSTDGFTLGGWVLRPIGTPIKRGVVVGHGYGGRDAPDFDLPIADTAFLFPCFRGLSRSRRSPISDEPYWHVLHDIDKRDRYIIGGCVEDCWLAVSAMLELFPQTAGHVGYMGISFGGGIGALAIPWDERIGRAHLNVPTFGHQPLRLTLPTVGSGAAVRAFEQRHGHVLETLQYYDAACAARHIRIPVHIAAAVFDPAVAPPGQFAIANALGGPKQLFVLSAGHFEYPGKREEDDKLRESLRKFFTAL